MGEHVYIFKTAEQASKAWATAQIAQGTAKAEEAAADEGAKTATERDAQEWTKTDKTTQVGAEKGAETATETSALLAGKPAEEKSASFLKDNHVPLHHQPRPANEVWLPLNLASAQEAINSRFAFAFAY